MLQKTKTDNLKIIEVVDIRHEKSKESPILDNLNVITTNKTPVIPVITASGVNIMELKLDEAFSLKDELEIPNIDTWSDVKGDIKFVTDVFKLKERSHFNRCLVTAVDNLNIAPVSTLYELISNAKINNAYHILVNNVQFKELLALKDASGNLLVSRDIAGIYRFNNIPICVLPSVTSPILIDLNDILVKVIGDIKEVKNDSALIRKGIRLFTNNKDFGIGFLDTTNIYTCTKLI